MSDKLDWFERGYQRAQLVQLQQTCNQILTLLSSKPASAPSDFWGWWARVQLRLGFIGTVYRTFRMIPWGLIFLAIVAIWKAALKFFA